VADFFSARPHTHGAIARISGRGEGFYG